MSNKDDHLIYESYTKPAGHETVDDILLETIDHIITALEGHGMLNIVAKPDRRQSAINKILKQKYGPLKTGPVEDISDKQKEFRKKYKPYLQGGPNLHRDEDEEQDDQEDFKTRLLRAIAQAGDADLNMPFEEQGEEDGHEKSKIAKEGTKGTQSDREKADVNDDEKIEPWEKKRANAIRKSQGKPHLCAKTVNHESYGPGHTIDARHAHPDVDGNIAWYVCEFKHGTEVVDTSDLEIVTIVEHTH